jgi:hypothetical protein
MVLTATMPQLQFQGHKLVEELLAERQKRQLKMTFGDGEAHFSFQWNQLQCRSFYIRRLSFITLLNHKVSQ